jgi:membrane-associated phospholipid phosphatase
VYFRVRLFWGEKGLERNMRGKISGGVFVRGGRRYLLYLLPFLLSLFIFLLCEVFISEDVCHEMYSPLDDLIPFAEGFVVFYVLWYFMIIGSLIWFGMYSRESFRDLLMFMTLCQLVAIVIFIIYPNKQTLRPEVLPRANGFSALVGLIHSVDTNTNVCPSLHVAYSFAMASVWAKERRASLTFKWVMGVTCLMVCLSTVFIKQHSVVDVFVSLVMCMLIEMIIYRRFWKELFTNMGKNK